MVYDNETCAVLIDAKELSDLANQSGDIDSRRSFFSEEASVTSEIYEKIYRNSDAFCMYDRTFSLTHKYNGLYYTVDSTADVIVKKEGRVRVDLISFVGGYEFYSPPKLSKLSKLKCDALFFAREKELDAVCMRLYYVCKSREETKIKFFEYFYHTEELQKHFESLIVKIAPRAELICEKTTVSYPSARSCAFPYETLREGQEIMIRECYSKIKQGRRLFIQAPTGTGKTIAALYPAVRALGNGNVDKIFYLTSKASTRREAFKAASKIFEAGAKLRTITIGAKEQVCMCPSRLFSGSSASLCNPIDCSYAADYYSKAEAAIMELAHSGHGYTQRKIAEVAKKHSVCPYELSLDLSELCDIIICDYNYVFDPAVYFRRYFSGSSIEGGDGEKYVFLVDEAHNLVDRARDMYSAAIKNSAFEKIYSVIPEDEKDLNSIFEKIILVFRAQRKLCADTLTKDSKGNEFGFYISNTELSLFHKELDSFKKKCDQWIKKNREHPLWDKINNLISDVRKYLCIAEYFDSRFYNYIFINGNITGVQIFCLDPSHILDKIMNRAVSTVMFSATLTPLDYFSQILGDDRNAEKVSLPSPFDPNNACVVIADYVSARYEDRADSISRYVSVIAATVVGMAGNYIAYFPSYECLEAVYKAFVKKYDKVDTIVQKRKMTMSEKEEFIDFFKDDQNVLRRGFCVLGGSFSEGIDLPGRKLIGTIIFGVGLPGLSNEKNILREYYDNQGECGYDYAYTFPGMNNVLQAAGRVIRRDDDKGVIVLADDRYGDEKYFSLFPEHWNNIKKAENARELAQIIQKFWFVD